MIKEEILAYQEERLQWAKDMVKDNTFYSEFSKLYLMAEVKIMTLYMVSLNISKQIVKTIIRSDQISRSVVSNSLRPHESQHARPLCPSPTPGVHWDSRPSSQWCHPAISSSVVPFSSCPQSLPTSESFPVSQLFAWGGQSTGVSALTSFLPKKSQGWSPSEWTGWISLQSYLTNGDSKRTSREVSLLQFTWTGNMTIPTDNNVCYVCIHIEQCLKSLNKEILKNTKIKMEF